MKMIPYSRQDVSQEDIDAVIEVLKSDYLTQGPMVPEFETAVSNYCGSKFSVATNSATSALHIACLALGVGKGDIVWTSPITFVASANCALHCGAAIDFVDIDSKTYNMSVDCLVEKLEQAQKIGKLPKVIIPVHLSGQPCEMTSIYELGQKYGFKIIEDASHAIGARYKNEPVGNCRYSDITIFSFHPVKIITTGEGGMATTNNANLAKSMQRFRSHGITSVAEDMLQRNENEIWNYQQIELGFNYRMTDIHAALGLQQMKRLDEFVRSRQAIAKHYDDLLVDLPILSPWQHPDSQSSFHLYLIRLKLQGLNKTQKQIYQELLNLNIQANLHYIPVYRQPYFEKMGFASGYCPESEYYYSDVLSIPMYPGLLKTQQEYIVNSLKSVTNI